MSHKVGTTDIGMQHDKEPLVLYSIPEGEESIYLYTSLLLAVFR